MKVFLFQAINSYAPIFITAYADLDTNVLMTMVISSALVLQLADTALIFILPWFKFQAKLKLLGVDDRMQRLLEGASTGAILTPKLSDGGIEEERLIQLEAEYCLESPPSLAELYASKVTLLGFITLFAPLAPAVVLTSFCLSFFTIRLEMKGFIHRFRRSEAHFPTSIGIWLRILELISIIAVTNNCAYLFFATDHLETYVDDRTGQLLLVICIEHAVLILKALLQTFVPDTPQYIAYQHRHARALRLKAEAEEKKMERHAERLQMYEAQKLKRSGEIIGAAKAPATFEHM